ncbi:hypothetical protein [Orrella sp. 11846]|uniref:hypothetical protein n=1 Tax=Orrella sp. 11846 TaxID=3409913 RepID=UPI003B5B6E7E
MLDNAFFVSDTIHEREVELADGSKHKLYFKEVPAGAYRRFAFDTESDKEQVRIDAMARLVTASLVTPDGKSAITFEQAKKLKAAPMLSIFLAIQEVNGVATPKTETGDSGTS